MSDTRQMQFRARHGLLLTLCATLLLSLLMAWQMTNDLRLFGERHQQQMEESVWLLADQADSNLSARALSLQLLLDELGSMTELPTLLELVKVLRPELQQLHLVNVADPDPLVTHEWLPAARLLVLQGYGHYLEHSFSAPVLYWLLPSREVGHVWVLQLDIRFLDDLLTVYPGSGFTWMLEDSGKSRVLVMQQDEQLEYPRDLELDNALRQRIRVSAPMPSTLWQIHALVDEAFMSSYRQELLKGKLLVVLGFILLMLTGLWLISQLLRINRRLQLSSDDSLSHWRDSERRYRDIFNGVGISVCLLDLRRLRELFDRLGIHDQQQLDSWLDGHPEREQLLVRAIHVLDANPELLQLLALDSVQDVEDMLHSERQLMRGGARHQLLCAVAGRMPRLELETPVPVPGGVFRHVWVVMKLPLQDQDYTSVTVSISDISTRRQVELTLMKRERFWSDVLREVPDILYIRDVQQNRFTFTNRPLALALGYSDEQARQLPEDYRERLLHPDDVEYMQINRAMQQVLGEQEHEWRVRWRHQSGEWRWFSLRCRVMSRTSDGRPKLVIGVVRDIHQHVQSALRLTTSEKRYRLLAENISDVIWSTNEHFHLDYVSPSVVRTLGYTPEQVIGRGFADFVAGDRYRSFMADVIRGLRRRVTDPEAAARLREQGFYRQISFDCIKADGHKCPLEMRLTLMWGGQGQFLGMLGIARDISEQRRTENRLRMAATVFENTTGAIMVTDPAGYIVQVNENFCQITGHAADQVIDQQPALLASSLHNAAHLAELIQVVRRQGRWEGELWLGRRDGREFPAWTGITAVNDGEDDLVSYVWFFVDISERKASEQRIESLAYYDVLTGLPNRSLFQDRLAAALRQAARDQSWLALLFVDLDRFKPINDTLGHAAGDDMLREVAQRLRGCVRETDTVARMGGDEFTLLLGGLAGRDNALSVAAHVAEKVLAVLAPAFMLQGRECFISASIGIALYPEDGNEEQLLLQHADTAMYHAKAQGKDAFQFFHAGMNATALQRLSLENDLRRALQHGGLHLNFQPQFACADQRLTGAEVLVRWQHPQRGLVPPAEFVAIAEEIGLITALGDWVLERACAQLAEWRRRGLRLPRLAINLSARQLTDQRLPEQVGAALQRHGIEPQQIELELTESSLLQDMQSSCDTLLALKALGVSLAVDDFGTGYSSLSYLKLLPIDTLKIDRSFISAMTAGDRDAQLAQTMVVMGHGLGMRVLAEGVESAEQFALLAGFGCDEVQGYWLGMPMPASDLANLLSQDTAQ